MPSFESIIRNYFDLATTNMDAWLSTLHEDIIIELPYAASAGLKERLVGKTEIAEAIGSFVKSVPDLRFKNIEIHLAKNSSEAFVTYEADTIVPATGHRYRQNYIAQFLRQDDRIILMKEFFDPTLFVKAFHK